MKFLEVFSNCTYFRILYHCGIYEFQNLKIRTDKWYSNWAPNEPNTEFNCVTMRPEDGKWKTESCQNKAFIVCARARVFSQPISIFIYISIMY